MYTFPNCCKKQKKTKCQKCIENFLHRYYL